MRPTRMMAPGSSISSEDLDAPAYTRALTSLREIELRQAIEAADRVDAGNRTFNQQFWATMASEAGGVPSGSPRSGWRDGCRELWGGGSRDPCNRRGCRSRTRENAGRDLPRPAQFFSSFYGYFVGAITESEATRIRNASRRLCAMAPSELPDAIGCVLPRVSSSMRLDATPCATR